jgi:hypothetical protein
VRDFRIEKYHKEVGTTPHDSFLNRASGVTSAPVLIIEMIHNEIGAIPISIFA